MSSLGTSCIHPAQAAMSQTKSEHTSDFEVEPHELCSPAKLKTLHLLDGARTALTAVGLVAAISILGVSADSLAVYHGTHLPAEYLLPLWPENFNVGPTVALVACSVIIVLANGASLAACRAKSTQGKASYHPAFLLAPPLASLIAALVAISFFYAVNASDTTETLQSWSCQWRNVAMNSRPHFGTLCKQSQAGVSLSTVLVPLQVIVAGVAAWQFGVGKVVAEGASHGKGSPTPSRGT